jgi:pimeloyl-ACP methyl ester carboxylesterase
VVIEERRIEVGGLPTRYLEAGAGETLVLLHALGESAFDWWWVLPLLARTRHVYAPDLPGFGGSAKPQADYSPAFFGRFAAGSLDALGLERAAVVGNPLGGLIALRSQSRRAWAPWFSSTAPASGDPLPTPSGR